MLHRLRKFFEPKLDFKVDTEESYEMLGEENHGAWATLTQGLGPQSVIYSFGVGEDASWDLALIEKCGVTVHAFDPTPKSIAWVQEQSWPENFIFHEFGIAAYDGVQHFTLPIKEHWVSYSPARRGQGVDAPVKKLTTIMKELGHAHIDVLKIDIEGGEYAVIDDLLTSRIHVDQILVEFHHRFREVGSGKTKKAVQQLRRAGFSIFYISAGEDEFSFAA